MKAFSRQPGGAIHADIDRNEALLLQNLVSQVLGLLRDGTRDDPAIKRLLPDAYPEDAKASEEFRRFTASGLTDRKIAHADTVMATLSSAIESGTVQLNEHEAQAWLRNLTDIRLTIASRLGIESDDQAPSGDSVLQDLYDWLGSLQNSLVAAVDHEPYDYVSTCGGMGDG